MKRRTYPLLITLVLCICSCTPIMYSIYGIKRIDDYSAENNKKFLESIENKEVDFQTIVSDTSQFMRLMRNEKDSMRMKNMGQPIKILYFKGNDLISVHINCTAPGFANINWNYENRFETFPPKSAIPVSEFNIKLSDVNNSYQQVTHTENELTIIIFYTLMLERNSLGAINTAFNNLTDNNIKDDTNVFLINCDKIFSHTGKD